jgi:hypothetical protein
MVTINDLKQELENINSYIKYYTEEEKNKDELYYWKNIQKYVNKKLSMKIILEKSMNS